MKKKLLKLKGLFLGLAITALVLGGSVLLARAEELPVHDLLAKALASYLEKNPDSTVANKVADLLLGAQRDEDVGVITNDDNETPVNRISLRDSNSLRSVVEGWEEVDLPSSTTTVAEQNLLGKDIFIDYAEVEINGIVSSTFNVYLGVTSSPYVAYAAAAGKRPDTLIDGTEFVTSSASVLTSHTYRNVRNSFEDPGTSGVETSRMASSSYFVIFLQDDVNGTCGSFSGASYCDNVTSSVRGWTGKVRYHYHYLQDL